MRKNLMLLALTLALSALGAVTVPVAAATHFCPPPPNCVTSPNGSQCCHTCVCTASGQIACTNNYCPPPA
jgi:hypothetical protein